jgi:hypothetical protein
MDDQRMIPLTYAADASLNYEPTAPHDVVILSGTLTANRDFGLRVGGAREGQELKIVRTGGGAFTWSMRNGSTTGTVIATFPASQIGIAIVKFNGSAWVLLGGTNLEETDLEIHGTFAWDPGNLADGAGETKADIAATGAAFGDYVEVAAPYTLQGITLTSYVHATDTLAARLQNESGGAVDLASGTWKYKVRKAR